MDVHLTKHLAEQSLHKALESALSTKACGQWMALRGMHPENTLHIVKQESDRHTYRIGCADTGTPAPELKHVRLDTTHHRHLQHLRPIPLVAQPPHWVPGDAPYRYTDKQYNYPTQNQQLATTLGHRPKTELLQRLEDSVRTRLYYAALRPDSLPAHLQKPQLQLEQLPVVSPHHQWYTSRSICIPTGYTKCICDHTEDET